MQLQVLKIKFKVFLINLVNLDLKRTDIADTSFPNSPKIDAPIYNQNLSQNYGSIYEFIDEKSIM